VHVCVCVCVCVCVHVCVCVCVRVCVRVCVSPIYCQEHSRLPALLLCCPACLPLRVSVPSACCLTRGLACFSAKIGVSCFSTKRCDHGLAYLDLIFALAPLTLHCCIRRRLLGSTFVVKETMILIPTTVLLASLLSTTVAVFADPSVHLPRSANIQAGALTLNFTFRSIPNTAAFVDGAQLCLKIHENESEKLETVTTTLAASNTAALILVLPRLNETSSYSYDHLNESVACFDARELLQLALDGRCVLCPPLCASITSLSHMVGRWRAAS
jgi:hypothetical protein